MRKIEEDILKTIDVALACIRKGERFDEKRLSVRDRVYSDIRRGGESYKADGYAAYMLWYTRIADVYSDRVVVRACGWDTRTTLSRLDAILQYYCNARLYSRKGKWYVKILYRADAIREIPFTDNMRVPRI